MTQGKATPREILQKKHDYSIFPRRTVHIGIYMETIILQQQIDQENSAFWSELCGTGLATVLGLSDDYSPTALAKFDQYYFDFYPYLLPYVKPEKLKQQKVLEIGLGYGTLGQAIATAGADYYGLDIATGPVKMMNHRLKLLGLPENAQQGSILNAPYPDNYFDAVVTIGCLHHTGNLQQSINEVYRILKPGGRAVIMVYNKFSLRQWKKHFLLTFKYWLFPASINAKLSANVRKKYDANAKGDAAPETVLSSIKELKQMLSAFSATQLHKENCDDHRYFPRKRFLPTIGRFMGLDIYIESIK